VSRRTTGSSSQNLTRSREPARRRTTQSDGKDYRREGTASGRTLSGKTTGGRRVRSELRTAVGKKACAGGIRRKASGKPESDRIETRQVVE
jgi:hypothetical protein